MKVLICYSYVITDKVTLHSMTANGHYFAEIEALTEECLTGVINKLQSQYNGNIGDALHESYTSLDVTSVTPLAG